MSYRTRQSNKIPAIIFPSTIIEWNKVDWKIKNSESIETFKKELYHSLDHLLIAHSIAIILKG